MEIHAIFETWHLGDGNYPPLEKGMLVNLSFQLEPDQLLARQGRGEHLTHLGNAEFEFSGHVLRVYSTKSSPLAIVECGEFRFYVESKKAEGLRAGDRVSGSGTLTLDYYVWVEYLESYPDPPDLFYSLRVEGIAKVKLPERFIRRTRKTLSYPARIRRGEYGPEDVSEVDAMDDEDLCHYVVRFSDQGVPDVPVPRTFIG